MLREGPLTEDLLLVQFHSKTPLQVGRSAKWWTPVSQANALPTLTEILEALALPPEFGPRESVSVARIPKGTVVTYYEGLAKEQFSQSLGRNFKGGGVQLRFKDFDPKWIVETRVLPR